MSSQRLRLGTFFGIGLYVHWTFGLLIAYVTYVSWAQGLPPSMVAFTLAQLLTIFFCVTLHEYGHALAARRYNVDTHDITLLPIGGVARLKQIPRVPIQELVIAIAGPAVNVVIAGLLLGVIVGLGQGWLFETLYQVMSGTIAPEEVEAARGMITAILEKPSLIGFAITILTINIVLVVFNMIPAFPMDGGRVLRSLLAMVLPYVSATRWAQRIGVVCALLLAMTALASEPPGYVLLLIAGFIVFAGLAELRQVEIRELVDGLTVGDVMTGNVPAVPSDMTAGQLIQWWTTNPYQAAGVVGIDGILLGQVRLPDLVRHWEQRASAPQESVGASPDESRGGENLTAIDLADPNLDALEPDDGLENLLSGGKQVQREFAVIDRSGRLIGWVNLNTLRERAALARTRTRHTPRTFWSIDRHA